MIAGKQAGSNSRKTTQAVANAIIQYTPLNSNLQGTDENSSRFLLES